MVGGKGTWRVYRLNIWWKSHVRRASEGMKHTNCKFSILLGGPDTSEKKERGSQSPWEKVT